MQIRQKPNKFYFFLVIAILISCNTNSENKSSFEGSANDSISAIIKQSKDLPAKQREIELNRALNLTLELKQDSVKNRYLSELSLAYLKLKDSFNFRRANSSSREVAISLNDSVTLAETYWDLGSFFKTASVMDSAYYNYAQAQKIYSSLKNDFYVGRMIYNMAVVQANVYDYTGSEINTIKAIEFLKPLKKYRQLYLCYNHLAVVTNNLKNYDEAIEYHQKALEYLERLDERNTLSQATKNNIGVVYQEKGNHLEAIEKFREVLQFDSLKVKDPRLYAKTMNNLAYSFAKLGKSDGLPGLFQKAIRIQDSIGDISGISRSYYSLGEFYHLTNNTTEALKSIKKARRLAEQSSNNKRILSSLEFLSRLDPANAVSYTQAYIKLNDSLQQEERKARNKFARIRFETNETLEQNRLLARQKQLWTGISIAVGLLAIAAFLFFDQRAKNQKLRFQQEQQASNEKIFHLMLDQKQKVEEGKKIAQKRISEELHDGVQGRLQGARMVLLGLNKRTTPEAIAERSEAIKELQDIQEEVRAISHELSHAAYQKIHNFINTINELLEGIKASAKLAYTFEYDENVPWDELKSDIKINLYRMVQESLQNCVKHAKADHVTVRFDVAQELLKVSIADNGAGFEIKKGKKGIGLRNIASRIEKIGGHWDIESTVGKGTTVYFSIPVALSDGEQTENTEKELQES